MSKRLVRRKITTKYCGCPLNAETDCRFHSMKERGWEICPNANNKNGRNLWSTAYIDVDTGEIYDSIKDVAAAIIMEENSGQEDLPAEPAIQTA